VNCEDVIAVYTNGIDTIADATTGDTISTVLLEGGCGDCIAIVPTNEDDWTRAGGCYVKSSVEVAFTRCAFSEIACNNSRRNVGILQCLDL